jgi:N-acetyl-1-D-myo-inositol-2-amino-2-deoxy-alpha-D-glucopyranoside deacetylase
VPALLCVHPHPDDETIACGGVLARYSDEGARTMVVTCTGGEQGENLAGIDLAGDDMAAVRRRELAAALSILGVADHVWLGYRDSGMKGWPSNDHPEAFVSADPDEAGSQLAEIIVDFRPDVVVCDDEKGGYGHPDHVMAHEVTRRALTIAAEGGWPVAKWYVRTFPRSRLLAFHRRLLAAGLASPFGDDDVASADDLGFGAPDEEVTAAVDVRPWLERKQAALRAHASQIGEDSFFLNAPDVAEVFGTEYFSRRGGTVSVEDGVVDDLFAGLR